MVIPTSTDALAFTCPVPPNKANARGAWQRGHFARKGYWTVLDTLVMVKRIPRAPAEPLATASVAVHLALYNPMDPDNLTARVKDLLDWLVRRGYLAGDTAKHIALTVTQETNRRRDAQCARVVVTS